MLSGFWQKIFYLLTRGEFPVLANNKNRGLGGQPNADIGRAWPGPCLPRVVLYTSSQYHGLYLDLLVEKRAGTM